MSFRVPVGPARVVAVLALVLASHSANAEPYIAQREGLKCGACHVNRTGGGKRNAFGYQYALTHLAMAAQPPWNGDFDGGRDASGPRTFDPYLNDFVSLGGNVRLASSTAFADEVHNTFESREANLYVQVDVSSHLLLYADTSVAQGSVENREAFVLIDGPGDTVLKAGYLLLPYGLRIWGDDEFIRAQTGYTYATPDLGVELGYDGKRVSSFVAISNGAGGGVDADNDKKISALTELSFAPFRVGLSGTWNRSQTRRVRGGGLYLGATLGRLTLLGEIDLLQTRLREDGDTIHTLLAYAELDFLVRRGLNLKLGYGFHDPASDVREDQRINLRAAVEAFPFPMLATTLSYYARQSVPQDEVGNADLLLAELHLFL